MKSITTRAVAGAAIGLLAAAGTAFTFAASASAAAPTYSDNHVIGEFTLTSAAGDVVSGGSTQVPLRSLFNTATAAGQAAVGYRGDDPDATAYGATLAVYSPNSSAPDNWTGNPISLPTDQGDGTQDPVVKQPQLSTTQTLAAAISVLPAPAQANVYELRLISTSDNMAAAPTYYAEGIQVDPTGKTFSIIKSASSATTTTLTTTPSGSSTAGANNTASVVVSGTTAAAASVVNFYDGKSLLGTAAVTAGTYTKTLTLAAGSHALQAVYDGDGNANQASGATQAYTVSSAPAAALPEAPYALLFPLIAGGVLTVALARHRRAVHA